MPTFAVNFSVDRIYEIVVEAESAEEARRMVEDDEVDYDRAEPDGESFLGVNNVTEIKDGEES